MKQNKKQNNTTTKHLNKSKMKTAMQLAIEHYEKLSLQGSNQAYVVANFLKENFLEMEKQQIKDANIYGWRQALDESVYSLDTEQYYNETFKSE